MNGTGRRGTAIIVAGMHRSGTSALARVLGLLGGALPRTLLPGGPSNLTGHWESSKIKALNDEILGHLGSRWIDVWPLDEHWRETDDARDYLRRAQTLLAAEFGDPGLWVVKDPRMCRLADFWAAVLRDAGLQPVFVVPVRNPLEVAASLGARDGLESRFAQTLWLRYLLDVEAGTRAYPRVFVDYGALLTDWQGAVDRITAQLGIDLPASADTSSSAISAFLSPSLRHHKADGRPMKDTEVLDWVRPAYAIFERWAQDRIDGRDRGRLDEMRHEFDQAAMMFGGPIRDFQARIDDLIQTISERDATVAELDSRALERDRRVAERDVLIDRMSRSVSWKITTPLRLVGEWWNKGVGRRHD